MVVLTGRDLVLMLLVCVLKQEQEFESSGFERLMSLKMKYISMDIGMIWIFLKH